MKEEFYNHMLTPIYTALCEYEESNRASLHVPGHKDGRVFDHQAYSRFRDILKIDITSSKGIDKLNDPQTFIKEAQDLAADAFGASHTFFMVGGSTVGNLATALTLCNFNDKIIVQRNMHKSVFNGLLIAGARPIFVTSAIESKTNAALVSNFSYIEAALQKYPNAKGVWITNPNYYGMSQDITQLSKMCHRYGIPLIVDEAHGAHFGQSDLLPPSALQGGADIVIQSTHKMLTAMTMSSMLHIQGEFVERSKLAQVLGMLQSTSPSYPLLATLDLSRRHLILEGRKTIDHTILLLEQYSDDINEQLQILSIWKGSKGIDYRDPLRWVISCKNHQVSGYQLEELLHENGATSELSDPFNTVFLFSIFEEKADISKVFIAMKKVDEILLKTNFGNPDKNDILVWEAEGALQQSKITMHDAFYMQHISVPIETSINQICGEMIIPYPPGIPILIPGEIITKNIIDKIICMAKLNCYFENPSDKSMRSIRIVKDK